ncbi:MAG: RNA 2'-phosphotransferase [Chloroflexota bacterium]
MKPRDVVKLSKLMSVALRHDPKSFNLQLDQEGWVALSDLVAAIAARPRWHWITADQVINVVKTSDKQRFEIDDTLIRARYGHSRAARPSYQGVEPPDILYHGTPRRNLSVIRKQGLKAMSRQYVHLSAAPEMAVQVGHRRDDKPALLIIRAKEAYQAGVHFGTPSGEIDTVYLVETVDPEFIDFPE